MRRLLSPIVDLREGEAATAVLMFIYSFLAMTAYNNIKPSATSKFIDDLGADNLPWVYIIAGLTLGIILQYYSRLVGKIPYRWVLPGTQVVVIGFLIGFWFLFKIGQEWVSAAFYFWGRLLLGIFLISQFWTLANDIYDPRQAKRIFRFHRRRRQSGRHDRLRASPRFSWSVWARRTWFCSAPPFSASVSSSSFKFKGFNNLRKPGHLSPWQRRASAAVKLWPCFANRSTSGSSPW